MKKCLAFFVVALLSHPLTVASQQAIVTDLETGRRVLLEDNGEGTRITDLATGESIIVAGQFAGDMTDEDYTELMRKKRLHAATHRGGRLRALTAAAVLTVVGTFSFKSKWETPPLSSLRWAH